MTKLLILSPFLEITQPKNYRFSFFMVCGTMKLKSHFFKVHIAQLIPKKVQYHFTVSCPILTKFILKNERSDHIFVLTITIRCYFEKRSIFDNLNDYSCLISNIRVINLNIKKKLGNINPTYPINHSI